MTHDAPHLQVPSHGRVREVEILAVRGGTVNARRDELTGEEPLEIRVAGPGQEPVAVAVTMRTPGHEDELAAGFLHSEGLIGPGEVDGISFGDPVALHRPDDTVVVHVRERFDAGSVADRNFVATASCGICGKASLDGLAGIPHPPAADRPRVGLDTLRTLPDRLREAQRVFAATGGLHATGLFAPEGTLETLREDVGRHNALDKAIGHHVLAGTVPLDGSVLLVSGRVSFELVQKAAMAGVGLLAAVSAPSDLAVAAAQRCGMTLVGFLRGEDCNIYTAAHRLDLP